MIFWNLIDTLAHWSVFGYDFISSMTRSQDLLQYVFFVRNLKFFLNLMSYRRVLMKYYCEVKDPNRLDISGISVCLYKSLIIEDQLFL